MTSWRQKGNSIDAKIARLIGLAVHGELEVQHAKQLGRRFDENQIHRTVDDVLRSAPQLQGFQTTIDERFPGILNQAGGTASVDHTVRRRQSGDLRFAIEVKHARSSHSDPINILKDLCRLAIIHQNNPSSTCFFVLAGDRYDVDRRLSSRYLSAESSSRRPILPTPRLAGVVGKSRLFNGPSGAGLLTGSVGAQVGAQLSKTPRCILTTLYKPGYPRPATNAFSTPLGEWDALVWRIQWVD